MTEFLERLPWRLGAVAGLLVGAASLIAGTDPWVSLLRVGAAFLTFAVLGIAMRTLMRGHPPPDPHTPESKSPSPQENETGSHVDQKTPEMTVDDL